MINNRAMLKIFKKSKMCLEYTKKKKFYIQKINQ